MQDGVSAAQFGVVCEQAREPLLGRAGGTREGKEGDIERFAEHGFIIRN